MILNLQACGSSAGRLRPKPDRAKLSPTIAHSKASIRLWMDSKTEEMGKLDYK